MNPTDKWKPQDVSAVSVVWPLHPNLPRSAHSGLQGCGAGWSSSRAGPANTSHWHGTPRREPITKPALLTAHYHSIRQVHLHAQPSDKYRPPRCMFNIRENYIVTANTKRLTLITWLPQDLNPIIGPGQREKKKNKPINMMQSACNWTIMNSYS